MNRIAEGKASEMADILTLILVTHDLLLDGAFWPRSPRQQDILTEIVIRSERLLGLWRDMCSVTLPVPVSPGAGRTP